MIRQKICSFKYLFICLSLVYVMPLKSFVDQARKTNALIDQVKVQQTSSDDNIIDISEGAQIPSEKLEAIKNTNRSSLSPTSRAIPQNKDLTSFERDYMRRSSVREPVVSRGGQAIDDRHNNIIATIIKDSNIKPRGHVTWECCKHKKESNGTVYCREFMSLCGKEKCKRATE